MLDSLFRQLFGGKRIHEKAARSTPASADGCREALRAGRLDEAVNCYRAYLAEHPDDTTARNDLGVCLQRGQRHREALECFEFLTRATPGDADAWYNAGVLHHLLGNFAEAENRYHRAIEVKPGDPEAHRGYSMLRLLRGDFCADAWSSFRYRRECAGFDPTPTRCPAPLWNGENIEARTVLVHGEQGLGDEILFASCYPDLVTRAARCVIECEPRLESLFQRSFPAAKVAGRHREAELDALYPTVDYRVPCGDLPLHFRASAESFPHRRAYLKPDPVRVAHWRAVLQGLGPGHKIGISWRGGTPKNNQAGRSIGLEQWSPVLRLPGKVFVSLQYGDCGDDLARARNGLGVNLHHWPEAISNYDETAALVSALDLVVTVTTSVAHLSGALGQNAWIIVNAMPRWCYLATGTGMPWYPAARLFRQTSTGEWRTVMEQVAAELGRLRG